MARMIDDHKSVQISVDEFVSANPEKIIKSLDVLFAVFESWDPVQELPLLCMIFEKVAFDNKMEATELADMIRDLMHSVREEEGEYVWPEVDVLRREERMNDGKTRTDRSVKSV